MEMGIGAYWISTFDYACVICMQEDGTAVPSSLVCLRVVHASDPLVAAGSGSVAPSQL